MKREVDAIVSLPSDVEPPVVSDASFDFPLVMIAIYGDVSEKLLTKTAQSLRDEASLLDHVDVVNVLGNRKEEISIELSGWLVDVMSMKWFEWLKLNQNCHEQAVWL